jgi:adenosylhomocysteinase
VDGIMRCTGVLLAGMRVVVCGYGMCGRGLATRMRGMGAHVIVTEVDALRALEAAMDGFEVLSMKQAAPKGELFVTVTGNADVLRKEHFLKMKDGAMVANSGHFNVEINIHDLSELAEDIVRNVNADVDEFRLENGNRIYLLGEGRLINLAAAEGHPACVMDMSFAGQALTTEYAVKHQGELEAAVHRVPDEIDRWVAELKLKTMGIAIDSLTKRQRDYMTGWQEGT